MFIPIWGRFPFWLIFFQMGWNSLQVPSTSIHFQRGLEIWKPRWSRWPWKGNSVFRCLPLLFCWNNQRRGDGFLEVEVQLSHHGNMEDGVRNGWMKAIWKPLCIYVLLVIIVFYLYIVVIVCWNTGNTLFWYAPYCDSSDLNVCGQMRIDVKVWVRQFCTKGGGIHTDSALPCGNDPATGRSRSCRGKSGVSLESGLLLFFFVDSSSFMISS